MNRDALAQRQIEMRERREEQMNKDVLAQGQVEILHRLDVLAREQKETREIARAASKSAHRNAKEEEQNKHTPRAIRESAWTAKQVAEFLGLSPTTVVHGRAGTKTIARIRMGRSVRFDPDDVIKWRDERRRWAQDRIDRRTKDRTVFELERAERRRLKIT